ncbi:terminase [Herbaspirillum sp. RTI4]|uniref:terminase n=1 Tax=Herbaspirillum sp. RTI4 TaxID=3048640 RepID=UPI002AB57340|nr:terminase [Herbaspirillum sp. RTI4]MDY7579366.1 terminase [Herbaspirillum sp. RTI4]MEA9980280.1 terminase [Herbaspirillum sp. RTI4]
MDIAEVKRLLPFLSRAEREELEALVASDAALWRALPGPQSQAAESLADITGFGGAAGGGKTDLACGLSLTEHRKIAIFRENGTELTGVIDRFTQLLHGRDGYNGQDKIWRTKRGDAIPVQIEFGSFPNPGDESKYQGRDHDLLVFDEAANMRESAVRFLMGWMRSTDPDQSRCRALLTFNPPTSAEGRWIIAFFAPWLDKKHPSPAKPGELRFFATLNEKDIEVPDGRSFVLEKGERRYDFDPLLYDATDIITPLSRTFIPSRVTDNPYLMGTAYVSVLQGLPEPLRSQMLKGDFMAGIEDDAMQLIPTAWVEAAQARWMDFYPKPPMTSVGIDVARGGKDKTVIARRHEMWFDKALVYPGTQTPDGPTVAGLTMAATRDGAAMHIDIIGVGASPYDFLNSNGQHVIGINVSEKATATDLSGRLRFMNQRSQYWWKMREALEPANNTGIMLPPESELLADLCAPKWKVQAGTIQVESREDIYKRIGRSPDWASAYILALIDTPPLNMVRRMSRSGSHNPFAGVQGDNFQGYDPFANI